MNLRSAGFSAMLLSTMAMSTLAFFALAVAASELQDEFDVGAAEIGILGAINTGVGGLFAPMAGRLSDQLGGRTSIALTLIISAITAAWIALSGSFLMICAAMAIAGLAQGWGNPACNRAIADGVPGEKKGIFTGIKQAGVQSAVLAAGFTVPPMASAFGWRSVMWVVVAVSTLSLLGLPLISEQPSDASNDGSEPAPPLVLAPFVTQVAVYGFLLGLVGGGLGRFIALYAEDGVGFSFATAGIIFGLQGLTAIPCRLLIGVALDRGLQARTALVGLAAIGSLSIIFVILATVEPHLLWLGSALGGMTLGSWNTVANLAMIRQPNAGRATGRLMLGFLIGLTLGGPAVGASIDRFGFQPAWIASAAIALAGAAVMIPKTDGEVHR